MTERIEEVAAALEGDGVPIDMMTAQVLLVMGWQMLLRLCAGQEHIAVEAFNALDLGRRRVS